MSYRTIMTKFRKLTTQDFRILLAVEAGMSTHEYVPVETIVKYSNLPHGEALHRIDKVHHLALMQRWTGPYVGFALNYAGYDFLALNVLVKTHVVEAVGAPLGVGKEADVHEALTATGEHVALKFQRLGRISFRQTKRLRGYAPRASWLFRSREAAEREFEALKILFDHAVSVPKPIAQNRNIIAMGIINGVELAQCFKLPKPRELLTETLENIKKTYVEAQIIHGDLSEFNIIVKPDWRLLIIDWPQYVRADHPNAEKLLRRDVENVLKYFSRKFKVKVNPDDALKYVKGVQDRVISRLTS
ncbi:MAG: RIO1 family regulatory kinase/ATPase [Candidatus Bathyarchaeota archaeon]